jgi:hypothetical protein
MITTMRATDTRPAMSVAEAATLRGEIRQKILIGALPEAFPPGPRPGVDAGRSNVRVAVGQAALCDACDGLIDAGEPRWEFAYEPARIVRMHAACERLWEEALGLEQGQ